MAQHDLSIANGSGAAVRADINAALAALASSNKGPTAPPAPTAGMLWVDDNSPSASEWTLLVYDGTDWIPIGTIDTTTDLFTPAGLSTRVATAGDTMTGALTLPASDPTDPNHAARRGYVDQMAPPGAVVAFARNTPPTGWLRANGAAVSRTTYAALFAAIGTSFGAGDGSTTFALPDLRGEFLRGWDDGRGVDSGRAFGSAQTDAFQGHWHNLYSNQNANTAGNSSASWPQDWNNDGGAVVNRGNWVRETVGNGSNGTPRTASETRPRNVALLICIKF